ncbi:hypothetical protein CJU89_4350 [Yarrowia sp. B02]|nr:hypothetical protein CJU89_4350 [Yarrowia sp. B02]
MIPSKELQRIRRRVPPLTTVNTAPSSPVQSVASVSTGSSDSTRRIINLSKQRKQKQLQYLCYKAQLLAREQVLKEFSEEEELIDRLKSQVDDAQKAIVETRGWFDKLSVDDKSMRVLPISPSVLPKAKLSPIEEDTDVIVISDDEVEPKPRMRRHYPWLKKDTYLDKILYPEPKMRKPAAKPKFQKPFSDVIIQKVQKINKPEPPVTMEKVLDKWKVAENVPAVLPKVELPTVKFSEDPNPRFFNTWGFRKGMYTGPIHEVCPIRGCNIVFSSKDLFKEAHQHGRIAHGDFVGPQKLYSFYRGVFHCTFSGCDMRFPELNEVFEHQSQYHGLRFSEYECKVCTMTFNHETLLVNHQFRSHNQTWLR